MIDVSYESFNTTHFEEASAVYGNIYVTSIDDIENFTEEKFHEAFPDAEPSYNMFMSILENGNETNEGVTLAQLLGSDTDVYKGVIKDQLEYSDYGDLYVGDVTLSYEVSATASWERSEETLDLNDLDEASQERLIDLWLDDGVKTVYGQVGRNVEVDTDLLSEEIQDLIDSGEKDIDKILDTVSDKYDFDKSDREKLDDIYRDEIENEIGKQDKTKKKNKDMER